MWADLHRLLAGRVGFCQQGFSRQTAHVFERGQRLGDAGESFPESAVHIRSGTEVAERPEESFWCLAPLDIAPLPI
jgi:hypothetical protein